MTVTSSWTGTININPTDPATVPFDPDIGPQQREQQQGGDSPSQTPSQRQDSGGSKL